MQADYLGPISDHPEIIIPFLAPPVPAGAPGPPEPYREKRIDLNRLFLEHPNDTYVWTASGASMEPAIHNGDYLIIDRFLTPLPGDVIIALVEGRPTVKRVMGESGAFFLLPENPAYRPIPIDPEDGIGCWGVVVYSIHPLRGSHEVHRRLGRLQ